MELSGFTTSTRKEPDWFRIGRDAVRVMDRLGGMRELDFYLRHPEPFIRLHAIRRVAHLLLPDAIPALARMLDDPLENEQNRDEAGWAIRRISKAKDVNWFARTRWTDRYDGTETAADRYGITLVDATSDHVQGIGKDAGTSPDPVDEVLLRIQMEEKDLPLGFSPLPWLARNGRHLLLALIKGLAKGFLLLGKGLLTGFLFLAKGLSKGIRAVFSRIAEKRTERKLSRRTRHESAPSAGAVLPNPVADSDRTGLSGTSPTPFEHSGSLQNPGQPAQTSILSSAPVMLIGAEEAGHTVPTRTIAHNEVRPGAPSAPQPAVIMPAATPGVSHSSTLVPGQFSVRRMKRAGTSRRKGGSAMFRLLFYPVRLIRHHWVFTLVVLVAFYAILGFSHPGRRFVYEINPRAQFANDKLVAATRVMVGDFLGLTPAGNAPAAPDASGEQPASTNTIQEASAPVVNAVVESASLATSSVIAPKGLNLRKSPASSGEKIVWMPQHAEVILLGETATDSEGAIWQSVRYESRTGWAMGKWLAPATEGE